MMPGKKEIYFVDDNADYRFLIENIFKEFLKEYKIRFFEKGENLYQRLVKVSALEYKGELPGLLLLDLNMPGIDGYNLLKLIRHKLNSSQVSWETLPVVILTNQVTNEQINDCYQAGVSSVIIKPLKFEELKALIILVCRYWIDHNQIAPK